jgi:hypothetical protein
MRLLAGNVFRNFRSSAPFPLARAAERHKGISVYRPHQWSLYDSLLFSVRLPSVLVVKCPEVRLQSCLSEPSSAFPSETNYCTNGYSSRYNSRGRGPFVLNVLPESYLALSKAEIKHPCSKERKKSHDSL